VLFVSHNTIAIANLCKRAILLREGQQEFTGITLDAIQMYLMSPTVDIGHWKRSSEPSNTKGIYIEEIIVSNSRGEITSHIPSNESFGICITALVIGLHSESEIAIRFTNQSGIPVFSTGNQDSRGVYWDFQPGRYQYRVEIPANLLNPGKYSVLVAALTPGVERFDIVENEIIVMIEDFGSLSTIMRDGRQGVVNLRLTWEEMPLSDIPKTLLHEKIDCS